MSPLVAGIDQGTSSTRCVVVDEALRERGSHAVPIACAHPRPGRVEQDPLAIVASVKAALDGAGVRPGEVAAIGIANQTETFVVWDRATGAPVHPAIVWQDRRTEPPAEHAAFVRARTGLELDATFPATKLRWLLDHVDRDPARLAYGDVASWVVHRLTGVHVTDVGNAGRTLLCALGGREWDDELLELFGIPRALLPPIVDTDAVDAGPFRAAAGDQQASLFGLRCWAPGTAKVTLGTGAFVLAQAGPEPPSPPDGILASCAWRRAGQTRFALEGFIPAAGAATDWFARVGALPAGPELDALLRGSADTDVVVVPAFAGTGSPSWDAGARAAVLGLGLGTRRADLARAVVDGVLHQVADALDALAVDTLRVDGGLSRSDWIVDRLADLAGIRVERTARADATALGAAALAGLAAGVWDAPEDLPAIPVDRVAEPRLPEAGRRGLRERWAAARDLSARWRPDG